MESNKDIWMSTRWDFHGDSVKAYCEDNDINQPEDGSDEWWEIVYKLIEWDCDDFWENIKYSEYENRKCCITGTLGLWYGRPSVHPTYCNGLSEAIRKCIGSSLDSEVYTQDGHLYVNSYHHDGSNHFQIHVINDKRMDEYKQWMLEYEYGDAEVEDFNEEWGEEIKYLY